MPDEEVFETELKLAVHDARVFDELVRCQALAGFTLRLLPAHDIRDRYWDTPERDLSTRSLSLRLRSQDGALLFTVKGAASVDDGLFRRRETELPATSENWLQIR